MSKLLPLLPFNAFMAGYTSDYIWIRNVRIVRLLITHAINMYTITILLSLKLLVLKGNLPGIGKYIYAGCIYSFMKRLRYKKQSFGKIIFYLIFIQEFSVCIL
jgi:hypothetical protein